MNFNNYIKEIKSALAKSMCLQHFSAQLVERHSKPEIEIK